MAASGKSLLEKAKAKVFFEKQDGMLCGQHCLNNALQASLFSAVDLSDIARQLDEKERLTMAARGTDTREYLEFMAKSSSNFDDSGYFSVQVLEEAFRNINLELVYFQSEDPRVLQARQNPLEERLFICHRQNHWFALRKFGTQWMNLNSTLSAPELLSDTYFSLLLSTLQSEGGRLFVVFGELPVSSADESFASLRVTPEGRYLDESSGQRLGDSSADQTDEAMLQQAIALSLAKTPAEAVRAQRATFLSRFATPVSSSSDAKDGDKSAKQ